ncbi:hypothetical protein RM549_13815 [Salegentibacter sp. F188]|uniref:Uncharacterized protein n=1 Tax=Autumnicola patrickiae TaxID=3075591 RepID=A0ABU3E4K8_9FLAO|nr:hypothetical protein [Salegentibacter sp. F188]MDT0690870.1 hypothetical protein [Salegentibacter sp. F188]
MENEIIKIILASSLIAAIISAVVSYFTSVKLKSLDFKNDYYKEILKKRLNAYELIENQIILLKTVVLGDDQKPYHIIFGSGDKKFFEFQQNLHLASVHGLWIDPKTTKSLEKLNSLFFNLNIKVHSKSDIEIETIGKEYYQKISDLRFTLENDVKKGLYNLTDMKKTFQTTDKNEKRIIYKE